MLPTAGDRQDFYAKRLFSDLARRFVHAYFGHFLALFETFSMFALRNVQYVHACVGIHNHTATAHAVTHGINWPQKRHILAAQEMI
jgi:hypothetical protein